jgi:hypothetical protein
MSSLSEHRIQLTRLGFPQDMTERFQQIWKELEEQSYEMYAMYTGARGSVLENKASCIICSNSAKHLEWRTVVTPSMDSAAIYCTCDECEKQYVEAALKQKALGRLLKERNTRPS